MSTTVSTLKLEFLFARAITPNATLKKLMERPNLKERLNIVIHNGQIQIATLVARRLKQFVANGFGKVAISICAKSSVVMIFSRIMEW